MYTYKTLWNSDYKLTKCIPFRTRYHLLFFKLDKAKKHGFKVDKKSFRTPDPIFLAWLAQELGLYLSVFFLCIFLHTPLAPQS